MTNPRTNPKHTTPTGLRRARRVFRDGWDADGVTVAYLPTAVVEKALVDRGWHRGQPSGHGLDRWIGPTGHAWDIDYAFALAIAAETHATDPADLADDEHVLRDLVDAVLERDPHTGDWAEVITERIVSGDHPPLITAVSSTRIVIASRAGSQTDLWQRLVEHVETVLPRLAADHDLT
jgi:hypothetical protein